MKPSVAKSGRSARIATKPVPPSSHLNFRSRAGTSRSAIPPLPMASSTVWFTTPSHRNARRVYAQKTKPTARREARMNRFFDINEAGTKGCCPFPLHPKSRLKASFASLRIIVLTIPNTYSQSPCQRRFAPTAVHLRSGTPFGFPPDSAFSFTGIPTHRTNGSGADVSRHGDQP